MIRPEQNSKDSKAKSMAANFIEPYLYKRKPKHLYVHELSLIKNMNASIREPFRSKEIPRAEQERKTMSMRELSIDQIKTKIKEYLGHNGETEVLNLFSHELATDNPQRMTHEQFRVSMFKNNAKKKVNLRILQGINPERYQSKNNDFSIKEACINRRMVLTRHNEGDLMVHKNGVKTRGVDFKIEKRKRTKNSFFESNREGHSGHMKRMDSFRPSTPKGWQSSMQPWKKWQQVENMQDHSLY